MTPPKSSGFTFASLLSRPGIKRKYLRRYSWLPDVLRIRGSIIGNILGPVLTVTIFAAIIAYLWHIGQPVILTNSVVPLLSVVVGLILVFRNGTSYDRYWEGRKAFGSLTANVRNISRMIWINVALPPEGAPPPGIKGKTPLSDVTPQQLRHRKAEAIHLSLAFAFAVKHYLREEDGLNHDDYIGVIPASFTRYDEAGYSSNINSGTVSYSATGENTKRNSQDGGQGSPDATKRVRAKRSKPGVSGSTTPLLGTMHTTVDFNSSADHGSMPLPLVIAHELSRAIFQFRREGLLETVGPAGANALAALVQSMIDHMTVMERIANTPIPKSYGIHLKQCVTLYVFALPFTLISDLGWAMIPVVTIVAFTLMGIEGIADEIEQPFGTARSDLPLDTYCYDLKEETEYLIAKLPEGGEGVFGYDDGEGDD
ncbi:hypothetical protein PILCRDRAFT_9275 [Piloderma croceum F 1598]|uniref:Uncharacterized protein n=1 Tax=Piloderma croceum (strain F 1598) TaxID=765440 RepID=A0A0C3B3S4_PILCF|nr:hypothetical protein PILCRDRAFT_9275 [Piloderma croceum F 1598]